MLRAIIVAPPERSNTARLIKCRDKRDRWRQTIHPVRKRRDCSPLKEFLAGFGVESIESGRSDAAMRSGLESSTRVGVGLSRVFAAAISENTTPCTTGGSHDHIAVDIQRA